MKRVVILVLACVMAWGIGLLAQQTQDVSESCEIQESWKLEELSEYDLTGSGYQAPDAYGWFESAQGNSRYWHLKVTTNRRLRISFNFSDAQFSGPRTDGAGTYSFPTQFAGEAHGLFYHSGQAMWLSSLTYPWLDWNDFGNYINMITLIDPPGFDVFLEIQIQRSGYADPAGTYTSTVTCTVSVP